ncbi:nitroreductase [Pseudomonas sp. JDS28PS106]|uniref:nitroreductase n=1 Tax=Pseudomonas sp. JDS28PS106 TaxID=2497235 RepID=UPI002FD02C35
MTEVETVFSTIVRSRRSTRQFLAEPVSDELIEKVLADAQSAPSNCNTQPWLVHIVSGSARAELSQALLLAEENGQQNPDFSFDVADFHDVYSERHHGMASTRNVAAGISREDTEARRQDMLRNLSFYGAPHVAFLFMPTFGDSVRTAGDIGMYAQTLLLSLTAHGLAGVPQTILGFYAPTIRQKLGIPEELKLLFGVSFGYGDPSAPAQQVDVGRAPLSDSVVFHR